MGGEGSGAAHHASPSIGSSGGEGSGGEGSFLPVPGMDAGCGDGLLTVEDLADALREAFLTTDAHFMRSSSSQAGSTAVAALVTGTYVVVANAGDSRCVLWREGRVLPLSVDHKPDRPDELQRIKDAGGWVAHGRVLHILAVARALGDRDFKYEATLAAGMPITADLVSASPEVRPNQVPIKFQSSSSLSPSPSMHALTTAPSPPHRCASAVCSRASISSSHACAHHGALAFPQVRICRVQQGDELLLACDGLWDVLSGEEAFEYLHSHGAAESPQRAVSLLVQAR